MQEIEPVTTEHEPAELLKSANDTEGGEFIKGYCDAFQQRGLNPPRRHTLAYYRGFVQGLQARYGER